MKQNMSFDDWMLEVIRVGVANNLYHPDTTFSDLDICAYKETFYDENYSPEDTVNEELHASN